MSSLEEKVLNELREDEDAKKVEESGYVKVFKKIGARKTVEKTLNVKPDFKVTELKNGYYYVFIKRSVFDVFKTLNKFLLFKKRGVPFDFKKLVFYITEEEDLIITMEKGITTRENHYSSTDLWNNLTNLVKDLEDEIEKEVILKRINE